MAFPRSPGDQKLSLHARCEIARLGSGEILFVGQTSFAPGVWVGVELDDPNGKNNGVVQGKRYFECQDGHGVFVRPSQVHMLPQEAEEEEEGDLELEEEPEPVPVRRVAPRTASPKKPVPGPSARVPPATAPRASLAPRPSATGTGVRPAAPRPSGAAVAARRALAPSPTKSPTKPGTPLSRPPTNLSRTSTPSSNGGQGHAASPATPAAARLGRSTGAAASTPTQNVLRPGLGPSRLSSGVVPRTAGGTASRLSAAARPTSRTSQASSPSVTAAKSREISRSNSRQGGPTSTPLSRTTSASSIGGRSDGNGGGATLPSRRSTGSRAALADEELEEVDDEDENDEFEAESLMSMPLDETDLESELPSSPRGSSPAKRSPGIARSPPASASAVQRDHMSLAANVTPRAEAGVLQREVEELRAKVRILEKKKEEDREKMREMDRAKVEAEQFLSIKPKLQAQKQELQEELRDLRKLEKDNAQIRDDLERQLSDLTDQLEMATLDKEVAEEKAEAALHDLETEREAVEEMRLELEVLKEENAVYEHGEVNEVDKASIAYIHLEKQNERLKEALIRFRDMTAESDSEQKRKISELEKELMSLQDLQSHYESVCSRLENAEAQVENLKQQVDDALGAEEMLEQITERNLFLSERVEEMGAAIEDLEALKELNDELEETHVETEKQLQEEVDLKDLQIREQKHRNETLEANIVDYENTFAQFRELVGNLQADLDALRMQQQDAENGEGGGSGTELASQSQAMLNLNMKLQSSALKSQAKTIELELGKLAASQAMSHLDMIKPYLPAAYFEADADAVNCLLFFQRMSCKADLIKQIVEQHHDIAESLATVVPEHLVAICQMRHNLAHFAALSRQITAVLQLCPVETFLKGGRMYREYAQVERRIDAFVDALRREELKETECGREFQQFVKQFEEFSLALGEEADWDLAAKEVGSATLIDLDLDTLAAALGFAKQCVATLYKDPEVVWELGGKSLEEDVFDPLQQLINNIKATKVPTRKVLGRLNSLYKNSEAVKMEAIIALPSLGQLSSQLVTFATRLSESVAMYASEVRTAKQPFEMANLVRFVEEATKDGLGKADIQIWASPLASTAHLASTIVSLLATATEPENVMKITGSGPWLARVEDIRRNAAHNVDAERTITKLTEEARDLYRQVKTRDQSLQERGIKIERLQKQLEKVKEQADMISEIRAGLSEAQRQANAYQDANAGLQAELEELERANDRLKKQQADAQQRSVAPAGTPVPEVEIAPIGSSNLETSYLLDQVENLRGAVKFLRSENSYLKSADLMRELDALPALSRLAISREVGAGASKDDADGTVEGGKAEKERETEKGKETEKEKEDEREAGRPAVARALRGETSLRAVASEHKALYDQLLRLAAAPKVVDLSFVGKAAVAAPAQAGAEATARGGRGETPSPAQAAVWRRAWQPAARLPERQYRAQKEAAAQLRARVERLAMRVRAQQGADAGGGARSMASYAYGGGRAGRTGAEGRRMPTIPSIA